MTTEEHTSEIAGFDEEERVCSHGRGTLSENGNDSLLQPQRGTQSCRRLDASSVRLLLDF